LYARQNPDGGWGEGPRSYVDPDEAGRGETSVPMTALVSAALIEAGDRESAQVTRAIDLLLAAQGSDGTWKNGTYLVTNIPPAGFYTYSGAAAHLPLEALARFRK
jgi:squalene-hopene/tetraprenyl-beta-curcumene cyclase